MRNFINLLFLLISQIFWLMPAVGQKSYTESFRFNLDTITYSGSFKWMPEGMHYEKKANKFHFDLKRTSNNSVVIKLFGLKWTEPVSDLVGITLKFGHQFNKESFELYGDGESDYLSFIPKERNETGKWTIFYELKNNNGIVEKRNLIIPYKVIHDEETITESIPETPSTKELPSKEELTTTPSPEPPSDSETTEVIIPHETLVPPGPVLLPEISEVVENDDLAEEEQAWQKIKKSRQIRDFTAFIKKFPNSKHISAARGKKKTLERLAFIARKKRSKIKCGITKEGNVFTITTENTIAPIIKQLNETEEGIVVLGITKKGKNSYSHEIIIEVKDAGNHKLIIIDSLKTRNKKFILPPLDNLLEGSLAVKGDSLFFQFKGGQPPYSLVFGNDYEYFEKIDATFLVLTCSTIRDRLGMLPGNYAVELLDNSQYYHYKFPEEIKIIAPETSSIDFFKQLIPFLLLGIALLLVVFATLKSRKERKNIVRKEISNVPFISNQQEPLLEENPQENLFSDLIQPVEKSVAEAEPAMDSLEEKPFITQTGFKIKPRKSNKAREEIAQKWEDVDMEDNNFYYPLKMNQHWTDSLVQSIHFKRESIKEIDVFLRNYNTSMLKEKEENIPEIGGMLLGIYQLNENTQQYLVSVEKFVPIQAKFQNNYRLEFDPGSMAIDLSYIQDKFPDLNLIGWFHTHPGHGLFLSQPDLKIQNDFFNQDYQFAMEIDSITENLDTGFFTRKKNGIMNNNRDRNPDNSWFAWTTIEKFTRHKIT